MPELPEVEVVKRGLEPFITGHTVTRVIVRERRLRWPIPPDLEHILEGQTVVSVARRAKYLLLRMTRGHLLLHLGMSGRLQVFNMLDTYPPPAKHDHADLLFEHGVGLRFRDPRRFGSILWYSGALTQHHLLRDLGPEPLSSDFTGYYLYHRSKGRSATVKQFIMDGRIVVGVGNIYASEALFRAGIHPCRQAGRVSMNRYSRLATEIKNTLTEAIAAGGTTIRDFSSSTNEPGYFVTKLLVYGRADKPCLRCTHLVYRRKVTQRSTFYCPNCQH